MTGGVAALGEMLLRLSPTGKRLIVQSQSMDVEVGGAEANVLAGLAALGHHAWLISRVADNPLGSLAIATLRARGVDTRHMERGSGRMGLYFCEPGQGRRASAIIYDRQGSAFAQTSVNDIDFARTLEGADLFHVSGVTPALGAAHAELTIRAVRTARRMGLTVGFDCNYREQLWAASAEDPVAVMHEIVDQADILFGNHRDVALLTGRRLSGDGSQRRRDAAECAFAEFPRLRLMASTARHVVDANHHRISARVDLRESYVETDEIEVSDIVDRIGSGDAFAAGVLHEWLSGKDPAKMARTGLALCVLKHGLPGDMSCFGEAEVASFWSDVRDVRR